MQKSLKETPTVIGLTGRIGSGKSTAAHFFKLFGAPIISADKIARNIVSPEKTVYEKILKRFGQSILSQSAELDRAKLRDIIFSTPKHKKWLENLMHPIIREDIVKQIAEQTYPYTIVEIPLLNERKAHPYLDKVLLIKCHEKKQIENVMRRDNLSDEQIKQILDKQMSDTKRQKFADFIIENDGTLDELQEECARLHQEFLKIDKDS